MNDLSKELFSIGLSGIQGGEAGREPTEKERLRDELSEVFTEGRVWPVKPNVKND